MVGTLTKGQLDKSAFLKEETNIKPIYPEGVQCPCLCFIDFCLFVFVFVTPWSFFLFAHILHKFKYIQNLNMHLDLYLSVL